MSKKLNSKGFTLIELLIVIIIIGILAAIAFVAYNGSQNKAHKASAQSTATEVKNKLGEYYADHSSYPATMSDLENWIGGSEGGHNTAIVKTLTDGGSNYTYQPLEADNSTACTTGDTVAADGTVTAGSTACAGYKFTASANLWGDSNSADDYTVTN